jgi:hypothetical protein
MKSTEEKCATVGVRYAFIGSCWSSRKTRAPTEAATNIKPTSVADEAIEVVPVAHHRCQIRFHVEVVPRVSAITHGRACGRDLRARTVLAACA